MPTHQETLEQLQARDFGAIEDAWLARLDSAPTDSDYFISVAETLSREDHLDTARPLLRLLDEELAERAEPEARLAVLLGAGGMFLKTAIQHQQVVAVLRDLYPDSEGFDDWVRIAGLHQVPGDERTLRLKVERIRSLMLLDVGSLVHMEGKGVGRIAEINFDLGRYKVDFERIPALTIGFKAGAKLLESIPDGHVLRAKIEEPERLETLRDEAPSELLREVLVSYDEPLTASQIKAALENIVTAGGWSRWWTAARKHPQVLVTSEKRQRYHWAATSDDAAATLLEAFERADLNGRLEIFSKNAKQNSELASSMAETLSAAGERLMGVDMPAALGVWFALSRAGLADESSDISPQAALRVSGADVLSLAGKLSQKALRESLYEAVRAAGDDWTETLAACALAEEDAALVGRLAKTLGSEDPTLREQLADRALNRPQAHPGAFVWLAKSAGDDADLRSGRELRLFRQLLTVPGRPEFAAYKTALAPLRESGGTLSKLIAELPEEGAEAAREAVERSSLEDYQRTPLVNSLEMRFASLRKEEDNSLYALPASITARQKEIRQLREVEIPENRQAIQEAAALGDLRENFEYKSARQRHEYLSARLAGLVADLARVQPIELGSHSGDQVTIGSTVVLTGEEGRREISILGPWESDPEAGRLSYQSEMGKRLLGSVLGDSVELENGRHEVAEIRVFEA